MSRRRLPDSINDPLLHGCHKRPVSRREFLGQGFLTGAAMITLPNVFSLLGGSGELQAAMDCSLGGGTPQIPFIGFDLAGGANIAGSNVLVGRDSQLAELSLEGYEKLGLPPEFTPQQLGPAVFNDEFGVLFHQDSAMLRGMQKFTSPECRANVNGAIFCARSANDTGNNPHNPMYGIAKAGASGGLLTLIGTESNDSGGRSMVPASMFDPTLRPTKIDRPSDARGLVDTGPLLDMLGQNGSNQVMQTMENLSKSKIGLMNESVNTTDLMNCAYEQSSQLVVDFGDPGALDPLLDEDIIAQAVPGPTPPVPIFSAQDDLEGTDEYRKIASVMKLTVEGKAGAATVEFGGYDYHNSTRSRGELKDERAGEAIGAALEFAHRRNQDLMIYVFSDGSVASNGVIDNSNDGRGKGIWKGDNSGTAASFILVYSRLGRPVLKNGPGTHQFGQFRASGSVETAPGGLTQRFADAPDVLAETVVLNYLALHNRVADYPAVMGMSPSLVGNLDEVIAFDFIRDRSEI